MEEYTAHVIPQVRLFDELVCLNLGNVSAYQAARQKAWTWLETYPLVNNRWTQYFEDVPVQGDPFSNLNQYTAGQTARYLLERPESDAQWRSKVARILGWIETNFGGTDSGEAGLQYGARVISEQNIYKFKMASHTSRFGALNALYAAATGDATAKDKAYRSLSWASYMARSNGSVNEGPAEFRNNRPFWFTDGHGDYVRHFMLAMGAFPEWAPKAENHLVKSTSVLTRITYAATSVQYATFDSGATETLRLVSTPLAVSADGVTLAKRSDLNAQPWAFDAQTGILKIRHDSAKSIVVTLGGTALNPTPPPPATPLLGNDSSGPITDYITDASGAYINANRFQARTAGTVTTLQAQVSAISGKYQAAIYADSRGRPGALLASSSEVSPKTTGWNAFALKQPVTLSSGGAYWLAIWSNDPAARIYATNGGEVRWGQYAYSPTWPASVNLSGATPMTYSIYAK